MSSNLGIVTNGGLGPVPGAANTYGSLTTSDAPRPDEWAQWFGPSSRPADLNPYDGARVAQAQRAT